MTADFDPNPIDLAREADFALGEIRIRPSTRQVEANGVSQTLQPRIMQVLVVLARRRGEVVSRDELTQTCWEGRAVGEDAINRCIQQIRKLGETSRAFEVETIPRVGYRLKAADGAAPPDQAASSAPAFASISSVEPASQVTESQGAPARAVPKLSWRPATIAAALVGVLAIAFLGYWAIRGSRIVEVSLKPAAGRIAFFGIDAPVGDLAAASAAAVVSGDILATFANMQRDVAASANTTDIEPTARPERARQLRAVYAVSGTATRIGDNLTISFRVDDAQSRTELWTDKIEEKAAQASTLGDRVAAALNDRLNCVIKVRASLPKDDIQVVRRLPKACESIRDTTPGNDKRWEELASLAPNSAWVLANEASALFDVAASGPPSEAEALRAKASAALRRAEKLDPNLPDVAETQVTESVLRHVPLAQQEEIFLKGVAHAPDGSDIVGMYSLWLNNTGRAHDALPYVRKAQALDPLSRHKMYGVAQTTIFAGGSLSDARAILAKRYEQFPDTEGWVRYLLDAVFHRAGDVDALVDSPPPDASAETIACTREVFGLAKSLKPSGLHEAARRTAECGERGVWTAWEAGIMRAYFGDYGPLVSTPASLFVGTLGGYPLPLDYFDPALSKLRADPRFLTLARDAGLIDYWRGSGHPPDFCLNERNQTCDAIKPR